MFHHLYSSHLPSKSSTKVSSNPKSESSKHVISPYNFFISSVEFPLKYLLIFIDFANGKGSERFVEIKSINDCEKSSDQSQWDLTGSPQRSIFQFCSESCRLKIIWKNLVSKTRVTVQDYHMTHCFDWFETGTLLKQLFASATVAMSVKHQT